MQAVSGAGYPGVASLDILGNVIPLIRDEEPKIETEIQKFLGTHDGSTITSAMFPVSAHANRVPVEHGHTIALPFLGLEDQYGCRQTRSTWLPQLRPPRPFSCASPKSAAASSCSISAIAI
ncbi:MAG: Asd/ArgC dimerization domain-containing protein [Sphingomonas sp.]